MRVESQTVKDGPEILSSVGAMRSFAARRPLGFVPTMGYLHEGHLSLLRRAREECDSVVLSIFVNPLQFGPAEDLTRYPRDEEQDFELAREIGVDAVFFPSVKEMYPEGFTTEVRVRSLEDVLEGAARPGHFAGVATVVAKLLNVVSPDRMYMGQKDAQQVVLVRRMMRDLCFPTELVVCPTVREPDGLAMSSRNVYLTPHERTAAAVLYRALSGASKAPAKNPDALEAYVRDVVSEEKAVNLEYVSAVDADTLRPVSTGTHEILLSLAANVGKTRLIDNVLIGRGEPDAPTV